VKKDGGSVFLSILQEDQLLYLDKRDAHTNPIKFTTEIETRRQPHFWDAGSNPSGLFARERSEQNFEKRTLGKEQHNFSKK